MLVRATRLFTARCVQTGSLGWSRVEGSDAPRSETVPRTRGARSAALRGSAAPAGASGRRWASKSAARGRGGTVVRTCSCWFLGVLRSDAGRNHRALGKLLGQCQSLCRQPRAVWLRKYTGRCEVSILPLAESAVRKQSESDALGGKGTAYTSQRAPRGNNQCVPWWWAPQVGSAVGAPHSRCTQCLAL